jgi:DNA-binding CsgD family transcriptional regulator
MFISKNPTAGNNADNGPVFQRPRVSLLNDEHWLRIRRQYCMSPRELEVAKLVCQGFSNEEIAGNLKIKQGTIKTHIRNIYRRIRVKNKIEMLLKFVDNIAESSAKKLEIITFSPPSNIQKSDVTPISPSDVS